MKRFASLSAFVLTAATFVSPVVSRASVVTSIPGGTVYTPPAVNYFGPGPETVAPGITWTSTNASVNGGSVFGYNGADGDYGFGSNGSWDSALILEGLNDSTNIDGVTDTMTFSFATPVSAVGGFLNYVPDAGDIPTIAVYNGSTLLESYNPIFLTGGGIDTGEFYGFSESTADITSFTLTDAYIGITDLTTQTSTTTPPPPSATPEPSSFILLGTGIAGLVSRRLRRS